MYTNGTSHIWLMSDARLHQINVRERWKEGSNSVRNEKEKIKREKEKGNKRERENKKRRKYRWRYSREKEQKSTTRLIWQYEQIKAIP